MSAFTPINTVGTKLSKSPTPASDSHERMLKRTRNTTSPPARLPQESASKVARTSKDRREQGHEVNADSRMTSNLGPSRRKRLDARITSYYRESKVNELKAITERYGSSAHSVVTNTLEAIELLTACSSTTGAFNTTSDTVPQNASFDGTSTTLVQHEDEDFFANDESFLEAFKLFADSTFATGVSNITPDDMSQDVSCFPTGDIPEHCAENEVSASKSLDHDHESPKPQVAQQQDEDFFENDDGDDMAELEKVICAVENGYGSSSKDVYSTDTATTSTMCERTPSKPAKLHGPPTKCDALPISMPGCTLGIDVAKPIVRQSFPEAARDRSPVSGLSSTMRLRVCFRTGEALNIGCQAVRINEHIVLELYARVKASWRDTDSKQCFIFSDLFRPGHPPYINAVFELNQGRPQTDGDCVRFLEEEENEKICRVLGGMRRLQDAEWEMVFQDIRETSLADIRYVAGIFM